MHGTVHVCACVRASIRLRACACTHACTCACARMRAPPEPAQVCAFVRSCVCACACARSLPPPPPPSPAVPQRGRCLQCLQCPAASTRHKQERLRCVLALTRCRCQTLRGKKRFCQDFYILSEYRYIYFPYTMALDFRETFLSTTDIYYLYADAKSRSRWPHSRRRRRVQSQDPPKCVDIARSNSRRPPVLVRL